MALTLTPDPRRQYPISNNNRESRVPLWCFGDLGPGYQGRTAPCCCWRCSVSIADFPRSRAVAVARCNANGNANSRLRTRKELLHATYTSSTSLIPLSLSFCMATLAFHILLFHKPQRHGRASQAPASSFSITRMAKCKHPNRQARSSCSILGLISRHYSRS